MPPLTPKTAAEKLILHEERLAVMSAWQIDTQRQFAALDSRLRRVELLLWLAILTGFVNLVRSSPAIVRLLAGLPPSPAALAFARLVHIVHF